MPGCGTEITSLLLEHKQGLIYFSAGLAAPTCFSSLSQGFQEKMQMKQKSYKTHHMHSLIGSAETFLELLISMRILPSLKYNSFIYLTFRRLKNERMSSLSQTHIEFMLQENMTTTVYQHFIHSLKHEYLNRRHFSPCRSLNRSSYLK